MTDGLDEFAGSAKPPVHPRYSRGVPRANRLVDLKAPRNISANFDFQTGPQNWSAASESRGHAGNAGHPGHMRTNYRRRSADAGNQ